MILYETKIKRTIEAPINGLDICTDFGIHYQGIGSPLFLFGGSLINSWQVSVSSCHECLIMKTSIERPMLMVFQTHLIKENKMAYSLDTKVGDILKDMHAVEILEKHVPGISKNPMLGLAKGMTLKSILAMPQAKQAGLTEEMVSKVLTEINAHK